jgi:hypothetical protein
MRWMAAAHAAVAYRYIFDGHEGLAAEAAAQSAHYANLVLNAEGVASENISGNPAIALVPAAEPGADVEANRAEGGAVA